MILGDGIKHVDDSKEALPMESVLHVNPMDSLCRKNTLHDITRVFPRPIF